MTKTCSARKARSEKEIVTRLCIEGGRAKAFVRRGTEGRAYCTTYGKGHETCECLDFFYRDVRCKHIFAVMARLSKTSKGKSILRTRRRRTDPIAF